MITLCTLEFFEAVHNAIDYIDEHHPDISDYISKESAAFDKLEEEWLEGFRHGFPTKEDRDSFRTYAAKHFYKKELADFRDRIWKQISMAGVRKKQPRPYLMGTVLLVLVADELLRLYIDKTKNKLTQALMSLDYNIRNSMIEKAVEVSAPKDFTNIVLAVADKLQELLCITDEQYSRYMTDSMKKSLWDYSVLWYDTYNEQEMLETANMCRRK